ncbi:MAG: ATP:cob(I)alamin adenosyltransferase [Betaproteobacteria bacterium]|nr:ATP:cob(I)alamin adenosyltransferase [Betaproteobacteria bacterium]
MSDRLTHITTRSGDAGETGLADGTRVPKTDPRIHALGDVDELNSQLGVLQSDGRRSGRQLATSDPARLNTESRAPKEKPRRNGVFLLQSSVLNPSSRPHRSDTR